MRCLAFVVALSLTGCSFVATRGPSDTATPPRMYPTDCTSSMTWPIVDGIFSVLFAAGMLGAISDDSAMGPGDTTSNDDRVGAAVSLGLFAVATGAGAYVGYTRVSRCRASRESYTAAYPQGQYYPQPYQPQPYYQQPYQPYPQPYQPQPYYPPQPQPQPPPQPVQPPPPSTGLGTEGDVCASNAECSTGLTCTSNVCVRPAARPAGPTPAPGARR